MRELKSKYKSTTSDSDSDSDDEIEYVSVSRKLRGVARAQKGALEGAHLILKGRHQMAEFFFDGRRIRKYYASKYGDASLRHRPIWAIKTYPIPEGFGPVLYLSGPLFVPTRQLQ